MKRMIALAALAVAFAAATLAQAETKPSSARTARSATAKRSHTTSAAKRAAPAGASTALAAKSAGESPPAGNRTLDEIHIEGEVAVPQVLFITARDQRRYLDFQHRRYLPSSRQLGESTVYPQWIQVNESSANEGRKETPR